MPSKYMGIYRYFRGDWICFYRLRINRFNLCLGAHMKSILILFIIGAGSCGVMADSSRDQTIYNTYNEYSSSMSQAVSCDNAALASATGSHQLYAGLRKPQVSLGFGGCEGAYAASVMVGGQACAKCPLINGSFSTVGNTDTMGIGIMWPL